MICSLHCQQRGFKCWIQSAYEKLLYFISDIKPNRLTWMYSDIFLLGSKPHIQMHIMPICRPHEYSPVEGFQSQSRIFFLKVFPWCLPKNEKKIKKTAPTSTALRLPTFVMSMVCTFSVKVVDPVPEPQTPANILQKPSNAIPRLTIPGVGGFELTRKDVEWYVPTWFRAATCISVKIIIPSLCLFSALI